jgi:formate hydrogenlyase subunit 3/multisubunit Na+/H+ antiporter MnhD subunit
VQSPTAFSIFLSGFLVKSAIYCLFMFLSIFNFKSINAVSVILMIMALILSGFGLFNSGDIKKLIA